MLLLRNSAHKLDYANHSLDTWYWQPNAQPTLELKLRQRCFVE